MVRRDPDIEMRHLRYFVTAAEQGSFRKAAQVLGVQKSAISRRIRDLEDRIGVTLFHRYTSGVLLTHAGEHFLRRARQGLRVIQEGARSIATIGAGEEGVIRIGLSTSLASGFLADLLRAYDKSHANVQIEFVHGAIADHIAGIRQLQLDVAFIMGTSSWTDCETTHLWSERVFAVLPDGHKLTSKVELDWSDLAGERFIVSEVARGQEVRDYLLQKLTKLGYRPEIQQQFVGADNLLPLVSLGRGLTLTCEAMTAASVPGVSYRPISGELLTFSAVWSPKNDNPACRRLLSLARVMARPNEISRFCSGSLARAPALPSQTLDPSR